MMWWRFAWLLLLVSTTLAFAQGAPPEATKLAPVESYAELPGFVSSVVGFQRFPAPATRYQDPDPEVGGGPPVNPALRGAPSINALRAAMRGAYGRSLVGDRVGAAAGVADAKKRFPDSVGIHWSEGWIRLNLLDFQGALTAWQVAEGLRGGKPFWVPYTKAVALMGSGDLEAALAWWQVAQRDLAPALDLPADVRNRFQHWKPLEKQLLERLIDLAYSDELAARPATPGLALQMLEGPVPHYPPALLRQGIEGRVMVRIQVDEKGLPMTVAIERSSGFAAFDAAALEVARLTHFSVPRSTGVGGTWALVPYHFRMHSPLPSPTKT